MDINLSAERRRGPGMQVHITTLTESKLEHGQRSPMCLTSTSSNNSPTWSEIQFDSGKGDPLLPYSPSSTHHYRSLPMVTLILASFPLFFDPLTFPFYAFRFVSFPLVPCCNMSRRGFDFCLYLYLSCQCIPSRRKRTPTNDDTSRMARGDETASKEVDEMSPNCERKWSKCQ